MKIPLTQGKVALIDDEDYPLIRQYTWHYADGYARTNYYTDTGKRRILGMHRLIMGMPEQQVDHRDRDGLNNRRSNLRVASQSQNQGNAPTHRRGVYYQKDRKKWGAQICTNNQRRWLGAYDTEQEALGAYQAAAKNHWGEFLMEEA